MSECEQKASLSSAQSSRETKHSSKVIVFYDGSCPRCVRDRAQYERMAGAKGKTVCWFDITGKDESLKGLGIDPQLALTELHIQDEQGNILSELDAYIVLMQRVTLLKPVAWFIALPIVRPVLASLYHWMVSRRLAREGRLPGGK